MKKLIIAIAATTLLAGCGGAAGLGVLGGMNAVETVGGIAAMGKMYEQNKKMSEARDRQFSNMTKEMANKKADSQPQQKQSDALDDIEKAAESKQ